MNCDNMRGCCSPCSALAQQLEETNTRAVQAYNIAVQCLRNPLSENLTINADLIVNGDIFQYGAAYETHAEKVYTNDDYIVMREGAVSALAAGDYSGFQVTKYDGTNDGRLVIDKDGTARVGDVNDEQPLATRDEAADLTDGHLLKWDAANLKLTDAGLPVGDILEFVYEANKTYNNLTPGSSYTGSMDFGTSGLEFENGYDYFAFMSSTYPGYAGIDSGIGTILLDVAFNFDFQAYNSDIEFTMRIYRSPNSTNDRRLNIIGKTSTANQPKLVSGTNIKTINNTSILGSGDITIAAGGLNWTLRAADNDWTDMFSWDGSSLTALKHVYLYFTEQISVYIPKGGSFSGGFKFTRNNATASSDTLSTEFRITIAANIASNQAALSVAYSKIKFTTDGSTVSLTLSSGVSNFNKGSFTIYTAD